MPTGTTAEQTRLLSTKLYAPALGTTLIPRPRLTDRLNEGGRRPCTVLSAPAGFGKTTLLTEWLSRRTGRSGWVSLDRNDNDPALFWAYVVTAFRELDADIGRLALSRLFTPDDVPIQETLSTLINDVARTGEDFVLVLDDYHEIENPLIHEGVAFLLERMPAHLHLVIASRSAPPIPLARLRGQGKLVELTPVDLRFTPVEASAFLTGVMGLEVSPGAVAALERRTEGWIAGLQLAALSMRGRGDVEAFVDSFSGDHRHIADFLVEEVLDRQPERLRTFLLNASVLQRMCGPLCEAVTGDPAARDALEELERGNLFVVHLDDRREWYRFHHLFADVLQARLASRHPDAVPGLHARAAAWFESHDLHAEAVHHALAARDVDRAADLVERSWRVMDRRFQSATWLTWVEALPLDIVLTRPVLTLGYGWALLDSGRIDEGEVRLDQATERLEAGKEGAEVVIADAREFESLPGTMAAARAYVAQARGDLGATERHAREALDLLPRSDPFYRGIPAVIVGMAQWARGELREAHASFADAVHSFQLAGNALYTLSALWAVGELLRQQGRLSEAATTFERALRLDDPVGDKRAHAHRGMASVLLERGDHDGAEAHLREAATAPGEHGHRWHLAMADALEARGDLEGALECVHRAQETHHPGPLPDIPPIHASRARILVGMGRLREALDWAGAEGISLDGEVTYLSEHPMLTLARLHLARMEHGERTPDTLLDSLRRIHDAAESGGRPRGAIEALVLQSRYHAFLGDGQQAGECLDRALDLAESEGFVQVFLQDADGVRPLIREAVARGPHRAVARRLSAALVAVADEGRGTARGLVDPLTRREVEVLRLVAAGLKNRDLAKQLFISESTAKRHLANTYRKLGVTHRTEAVAKANDLRLL
jgi:LuxR family maltose regulon positive regulatory protein